MKCIIILTLALALTGCAASNWVHESKGSAEFDTDKYQCDIEAGSRTADTGYAGNPLIKNDYWKECMNHRGWVKEW